MFLLIVPWVAGPVAAGPEVLREAYTPTPWDTSFENVYVNQEVAQSFVARTDFLLTHLELFVFDQPNSGSDILQLFIASDAGNQPGSVLGSSAQQGAQNWTWVAFGFYPWVSLSAGQRYWIVAADSEPRPKGYEWATSQPGGYATGEAEWYDTNTGLWVGTGADLFFRVYGVSGPSLTLQMEPNLVPVDPGASVPIDMYFNNSGNEPAATARIEMYLDPGLTYQGDDAANEGGVQVAPLTWSFNGVAVGPHRVTVWTLVEFDRAYYDGQSLHAHVYLNYTDSAGQLQATTSDSATVTVIVPVIRAEATAVPLHVSPGESLNLTISLFNVGSGVARSVWLNASLSANLAGVGDNAASSGAVALGPLSWRFDNVSGLAYVFNVTVRADSTAQPGDRLEFRMDLAYTDGAGHPFGSLSETAEATIHGPSILAAAAADKPAPRPGDAFHVVLYANNTGDDTASRLWLNVTLPSWATLEDSQPIAGTLSGGFLRYVIQNAAPGPFSITLRLRVLVDAPPAAPVNVAATLDVADANGTRLRSSSALASSSVLTPRFVLVFLASATTVSPGETVDITLGWNNTGNEAAARVWLNFTLPAKTLLVNSSVPWATTDGTTYAWVFDGVSPGPRQFGIRIEGTSRLVDGDSLVARLDLDYKRADGLLFAGGSATASFTAKVSAASSGLEVLFLWIAVLAAVFLLFLLLSYMGVLPHRRSSIDDVFLLHNSGILICHYSTTMRPDVDSDIAGGMLMAVRNFVADALRSKNGSLQELKYGDYRIRMVHGRHSILVVFTRGPHTKGLEARMKDVLAKVESAFGSVLESWSGRTEEFKGVEEHLLRLVQV